VIRRHPLVVATLAVIVLVMTLGATPPSAIAQEGETAGITFKGEWALVAGVITNVSINLEDPTSPWAFEGTSVSQISGDFVGFDYTEARGTFDPMSGNLKASFTDTFHGVYVADGSNRKGTMTLEGIITLDGETNKSRGRRWITGGTLDFEGARGHWHCEGEGPILIPGGHRGPCEGVWACP
jgi:hypothetical protein